MVYYIPDFISVDEEKALIEKVCTSFDFVVFIGSSAAALAYLTLL